MSWAAGNTDKVAVVFTDTLGQTKTVFFLVSPSASDADIQALIAAMQAQSDMSIQKYSREVTQVDDSPQAAVAFGPGHNYALLTMALQLNETCGPDTENTRLSILGPSETGIIKGPRDKATLDPTSANYAALKTAAVAVQINTDLDAVADIKSSQIQTRKNKSRLM